MTDHPNYRENTPPDDKRQEDYNWAERRAELYDLVEKAGSTRHLSKSTRELGDRYDVSHTTIQKDLDAIREFEAENLGEDVETEISLLESSAVEDHLQAAKDYRQLANNTGNREDRAKYLQKSAEHKSAALQLATTKLRGLQSVGEVPRVADEISLEAEVDQSTEVELDETTRAAAVEAIRNLQEEEDES
jgi:hypothetical protein